MGYDKSSNLRYLDFYLWALNICFHFPEIMYHNFAPVIAMAMGLFISLLEISSKLLWIQLH